MAVKYNVQPIVTDGLKVYIDGANPKSHNNSANVTVYSLFTPINMVLKAGASHNASGSYWSFDGTNDYAYINDVTGVTDFTITDDYTVSFWVYLNGNQNNTQSADNDVVEKWSASGGYPYVFRYIRSNATMTVACYNGSSSNTSTIFISSDAWWNITGVFDWSNSTLRVYGYAPVGSKSDTNTTTLNLTGTIENTSNLQIMRRGNGTNYATGNVAALKIYDRALSEAEVLQNYNALKSRFGS